MFPRCSLSFPLALLSDAALRYWPREPRTGESSSVKPMAKLLERDVDTLKGNLVPSYKLQVWTSGGILVNVDFFPLFGLQRRTLSLPPSLCLFFLWRFEVADRVSSCFAFRPENKGFYFHRNGALLNHESISPLSSTLCRPLRLVPLSFACVGV